MSDIYSCTCCLKVLDFSKDVKLGVLSCSHICHTEKCIPKLTEHFCGVCWKLHSGPLKTVYVGNKFECAICLMPAYELDSFNYIVSTECGHVFHKKCIANIKVSIF